MCYDCIVLEIAMAEISALKALRFTLKQIIITLSSEPEERE